jgi:exopolyphosphatase/guanosine-5'-triphosphate,3'-diphosphate pyrophosphatase
MSTAGSNPGPGNVAVIDVGSNSVRLVLYRLDGRAIWSVFNEKVLAGLGRDLKVTGRLSPEGVAGTLVALKRFRAVIDANPPGLVFAAATAAVREARDGEAFRRRVEEETGFHLTVLSGEEEARFAALGVLAGAPTSRGVVGDLGGASLELIHLGAEGPAGGVTLPLGPFAMGGPRGFDATAVRAAANHHIGAVERAFKTDTLHAVGGAWRNLAMLQMRMSDYPLPIIHQYEISRREILEATRFVSQQSRGSLERVEGISRRRVEGLPHAAIILETLVQRLDIQRVVLSAYGLRERLVWQAMDDELRQRDPLVAGCAALGNRAATAEALGQAVESWAAPAFAKLDPVFGVRDRALLNAACRLAELGAQFHPDHRAMLVFQMVLRAPFAGIDHTERAFLACVAFGRQTSADQSPEPGLVSRILSPEQRQRARALGAAIRLACDLSGRSPQLLARTKLDIKPGEVVLTAEETWGSALLGDQTAKRGQTLAKNLSRELKLRNVTRKPRLLASAV